MDEYEIQLPEAWRPDGNFPRVVLDEENLTGLLEINMEGDILRVRREISLRIPEKLEKSEETALLKKINTTFDRTILFLNTTPTASSNPSHE